jgi:predicted dehydrogenase
MISTPERSGAPLRGAIIGYGFIGGHGHLPAYLERERQRGDVRIEALADTCPARRAKALALHPTLRVYDDHRALIAAEADRLDFVDICTPPCDHAEIAHAAMDAGLHVLCEKPLTTSLHDAERLLNHARRAKRVLFPCHNYKHAPVVQAIRECLDTDRIGTVKSVTLNTMRNTHAKGVTEWHTHWRRHQEYSGGGIVMDHGSHSFYLLFDWFGAYPESVTARTANLFPDRYDTEDNASIVLMFPTGFATVQLSWTSGVRKVQYAIHGDSGAITVDDDDLELSVMKRHDGPDIAQGAVAWDVEQRSVASHWGDASHTAWFDALLSRFTEAIATRDHVGKDAIDAYHCIATIAAVYASAAAGCREMALRDVMPQTEGQLAVA